jgi:eukaryotic-like serine/threonine-protein kinase
MVEPQSSRFWMTAQQSGLLDVQSLTACWNAVPLEKRDAMEHLDRRLARQAVQQNYLTLWQAQQLLAGRTSGFRVDRYLLLDLIGQGGMGRVYLARDTRLNRQVALKILAPERMNNPRAVARFQREARVGAQLQHENLVRIYDFGEANGRYFLVMEYIEGKTIGALITAQGPMPSPTAARLTWQIALGLEHAHRKGLIHRDVNPYNILVTHEGIAKLADLGLAIDLAEDDRVTREGATVGTFDYVAPEQARHSHAADIRSDIYSLGCTLYHMVSGQVPFPSPSLPEKLFAHQAMEPTPLDQLIPDIPAEFVELVQRMMRKLPEERYATPLQLAQALEPFIEEYPRIRDGEPVPAPLIIDEPAVLPVVSPPASGEIQAEALSPTVLKPLAQFAGGATGLAAGLLSAAGPGREPSSPSLSAGLSGDRSAVAAPSVLTPVNDNEVNSNAEDVPLILDLGPEPSLSDSLSRSKSWFGTDKPGRTPGAPDSSRSEQVPVADDQRGLLSWQNRPWLWALAVAAVALALLVVGYALARWFGQDQKATQPRNQEAAGKQAANLQPGRSSQPANGSASAASADHKPKPKPKPEPAITVLASDGEETPVEDLFQAMETAVGAKGWVILHNREPLLLPARDRPVTLLGTGWLKLRAATGVNPVLIVELKGQKPFLTVGPAMNLTLEGLTVEARYPDPPPGGRAGPAPIIQAGGPAQFRHCAFEVATGTKVNGTRAIVADGGDLTIENCWFKGFQAALEVHAIGGSTTLVRQTMVVPATRRMAGSTSTSSSPPSSPAPASSSESTGWGFRMQFLGGGGGRAGSARRLILDHCTVAGTGLLQLAGFSLESPLQVEAKGCAVQTEALVARETATPETPLISQSLQWQGKGNQLDVSGPSWIVPSGKGVPGPATGVVVDREGWARIAGENEPVIGGIQFSSRPEARPESLAPSDYAIEAAAPGKVGANPEQVGPQGARPRQAAS